MRIVIDLQACQTEGSHNRGIGRYSLALAKAIAGQQENHDVRFVLNALYEDQVKAVKDQFKELVAPAKFSSYQFPYPDKAYGSADDYRRPVAEVLIRHHYAQLRPDILHISSVFEGYGGKAVVPGRLSRLPGIIFSATLYDLIPLIMSDLYLPDNAMKRWYRNRLQIIRECDLLLAISEASRKDAIQYLGILPEKIVTISGAADAHFRPLTLSDGEVRSFLQRYKIKEKFVLYTGGIDYRKNIEGTVRAYAKLPEGIRRRYQLVIVCGMNQEQQSALLAYAAREGLAGGEIAFAGFVPEEDLVRLYNLCTLFIFPSLYEGFGLPILEAMFCGAPVLGADNSSIPEIVGRQDALFDGKRPDAIAAALYRGLTDTGYRNDLKAWSAKRAGEFNWDRSAAKALAAFEEARERSQPRNAMITAQYLPRRKMACFFFTAGSQFIIAASILPELARYYEIDLFMDDSLAKDEYIIDNFPIFPCREFNQRHAAYDITIYPLGNPADLKAAYELLQQHPGIVVLHDFFPEYPDNCSIPDTALGIIVHSRRAEEPAKWFYKQRVPLSWEWIDIDQHPGRVAAQYTVAIEKNLQQQIYKQQAMLVAELGEALAPHPFPEPELEQIADFAIASIPTFQPSRLLIDVSFTIEARNHGGIQRVVKNITTQLCQKEQRGWHAMPVRSAKGKLYPCQGGRLFPAGPVPLSDAQDACLQLEENDIFLLLDASWLYYDDCREVIAQITQLRGRIYTVVYDLLPVLFPSCADSRFSHWLETAVRESDGLVSISRTVADELAVYIQQQGLVHKQDLKIGYFHLGADIQVLPAEAAVRPQVTEWFNDKSRNLFLMVGTIAPRKGHAFALAAFERLWDAGVDVKLAIAGNNWVCKDFAGRLLSHPEYGRRLIWFDNPTDAEILCCYRHAAALLFPSNAEGFGLPLMEAAQSGLPVLCSDIPVFREVAGEYATYFSLDDPQYLADMLKQWLNQPGCLKPAARPGITWKQSAGQLLDIILHGNWYKTLP
ncbi:glycosyltransferase family 4 protein [Lucifera butyrica]|nr:glycosyltransferase family 1 protein [Lucifera butyrica]